MENFDWKKLNKELIQKKKENTSNEEHDKSIKETSKSGESVSETRKKVKKEAEKAFRKQNFSKAYTLYCQLLDHFDDQNYETIECLIGAALNLGYLDVVFQRTDELIQLDPKRSQVKLFIFSI